MSKQKIKCYSINFNISKKDWHKMIQYAVIMDMCLVCMQLKSLDARFILIQPMLQLKLC